ncbi:M23 family metallopeptidase [Fibrella rubiginis]
MDFPQPVGTPVYATADGYVSQVGLQSDGLGLSIQLIHESGYITTYGHLSRYEVQPGQRVRRGQRIGQVGQTGITTGPHLHYIVRYKGQAIDPRRHCFLILERKH